MMDKSSSLFLLVRSITFLYLVCFWVAVRDLSLKFSLHLYIIHIVRPITVLIIEMFFVS